LNYLLASTFIFGTITLLGLNLLLTTYIPKGNEKVKYQSNMVVLVSTIAFIAPLIILTGYVLLSVLLIGVAFFQMSIAEILGRKMYRVCCHTCRPESHPDRIANTTVLSNGIPGIIVGYTISFLALSYR